MRITKTLIVVAFMHVQHAEAICKAVPGTPFWPSLSDWATLNSSIGGQLIKPVAPGAVCHPNTTTYSPVLCSSVQSSWSDYSFVSSNPVASAWNNYNNDTCLPNPSLPCSAKGYPAYVVNATMADHVKAGVDFAREHNLRLIVKGTGHDYMGRSSAPNSLSIWTKHLTGISFHNTFAPANCRTINHTAVTIAAGHYMDEIYNITDAHNLTIVGGMAQTVGIGGYLQGAGHGPMGITYGLGADNILELSFVSPQGEILTANACQNREFFYAFRGGGGGTFGVLLNVTVNTFPTPKVATLGLQVIAGKGSEGWWDEMAYLLSQYPYLAENNIMGYPSLWDEYPLGNTSISAYQGTFVLHNGSSSTGLKSIFAPILAHLEANPAVVSTNVSLDYPSFYSYFQVNHDSSVSGTDLVLGSRLIGAENLGNVTALKTAMKGFGVQGASPFLLGGKGIQNVVPQGGEDAVNPAWRTALVHYVTEITWPALNATAKGQAYEQMNEKVEYLRDLQPVGGAYVNEANINEPEWQYTFWGDNYPRLLAIKALVDPTAVFWCHPCVGSGGGVEVGDRLCQI